jgi:hypothetical protein
MLEEQEWKSILQFRVHMFSTYITCNFSYLIGLGHLLQIQTHYFKANHIIDRRILHIIDFMFACILLSIYHI